MLSELTRQLKKSYNGRINTSSSTKTLVYNVNPQKTDKKEKEKINVGGCEAKNDKKGSKVIHHLRNFSSLSLSDLTVPYEPYSFFKLPLPTSYNELKVLKSDAPITKKIKIKDKKHNIYFLSKQNDHIRTEVGSHHKCISKINHDSNQIKLEYKKAIEEKEKISSLVASYKSRIKLIHCEIKLNKNDILKQELEKLKEETEIYFLNTKIVEITNKNKELAQNNEKLLKHCKQFKRELLNLKKQIIEINKV